MLLPSTLSPPVRRGPIATQEVYNGSEFVSKAMDAWASRNGVQLDFIYPRTPVENAFIESFNGRLQDECLTANRFFSLAERVGRRGQRQRTALRNAMGWRSAAMWCVTLSWPRRLTPLKNSDRAAAGEPAR